MPAKREFTFTERGLPTLAQRWTGEVPAIPDLARTAIGRLQRGVLDDVIEHLCKKWMSDHQECPEMCSVEWLAHAATEICGDRVPNASVSRVLGRWSEVGYAMTAQDPPRFIGLTPDGITKGLSELQRQARIRSKTKAAHYDWDAHVPRKARK